MRNLILLGLLAVVAVTAGCNSNGNSGSMTGWTDQIGLVSGALTPPEPPVITPEGAVYGTISNVDLSGGTFTVTTLSGEVVDVVLAPTAKVLYQGNITEVSASKLANAETVTVSGVVIGLPAGAKVRAALVVINSSTFNQQIIEDLGV